MPDDFNRSDVQADFRDVYKQTITDEVVVKFYNTQLESIKLRFDVNFQGAPITLKDLPAFPTGNYQVVITPTKYRLKQLFYDVEAGKTNELLQDFFVHPDQARPRLIDFGDIPAKTYATDLQRILGNSNIDQAAWSSLDKRNRATILNLSAKMSREGITDGTKLIKLVNSIDRMWLDVKHRERVYFHVDKNLFQALLDYPAIYTPVSGGMHRFPDGYEPVDNINSFKTLHDKAGNIQLTFARGEGDDWLADVDLDDHKGLEHVADVLKHEFSGKDTDPYDIHQILWYFQGLDAEYRLMSEELELDEIDKQVLESLIGFHGAMPFIELTSVTNIDDDQLAQRVAELEKRGLVRVIDRGNILEEIISVTGEGFKSGQLRKSV